MNPGGLAGGLELKDLGKRSVPRNPLLFGTLYRMNLVENVGSGFKRIKADVAAAGLPELVLDIDDNWFSICFTRVNAAVSPTGSQKASEKTSEKMSKKTSEKIVKLIAIDNRLTISELSATLGVSARTIERNIEKLRTQNRIKRIGPDKGGHWEVLN